MTQGMKTVDPVVDHEQVQWVFASTRECPDEESESRLIRNHFRIPHDADPSDPSFVDPVVVYRTQRRVLLHQRSGLLF